MYGFDFRATAERLRTMVRTLKDHDSEGAVADTTLGVESEMAVQSVLYLYDHMARRGEWVGAAHLLAWAVPASAISDPRVRFLLQHALAVSEGKFCDYEKEMIRAREGTLAIADEAAMTTYLLPPRARYLRGVVALSDSRTVLEYGCGSGMNVFLNAKVCPKARWDGFDISTDQVEICRSMAVKIGLGSRFIGPTDAQVGIYDVVAVLDVLEHTAYPANVLENAERFTTGDGLVVVTVPGWRGSARTNVEMSPDRVGDHLPSHVNTTDIDSLVAFLSGRGEVVDVARLHPEHPSESEGCAVTYRLPR